jgi:hypothetical protein
MRWQCPQPVRTELNPQNKKKRSRSAVGCCFFTWVVFLLLVFFGFFLGPWNLPKKKQLGASSSFLFEGRGALEFFLKVESGVYMSGSH